MITLILLPVLLIAGLVFWLLKGKTGNVKNGEGPADHPPAAMPGKPARATGTDD